LREIGFQAKDVSQLWPCHLHYLKANEELWKLKYFTMKKYNLQKNPLKETKIIQDSTIL
jgi:hypothetical protein